jgi:RimJ/RimL family protein N-acetyltransferase
MPRSIINSGQFRLKSVEPNEIESIRLWRNSQMDILRQSRPISSEDQKQYFESKIWTETTSNAPKQILVSFYKSESFIGYGGLVNISWHNLTSEISFLLNPELENDQKTRKFLFINFLHLICILAFEDLGLFRLFTETYSTRVSHIATLEEYGFYKEGSMREHIIINGQRFNSLLHGLLRTEWGNKNEK